MAVIPRRRASGMVYGVVTSWRGRKYWELVGANRREAEGIDARRKKEVKAGTYRPGAITDRVTVATFAAKWLDGRRNRSADNDRMLLERHALKVTWFAELRMRDVTSAAFPMLADELSRGKLAPKSVSLVMGLVRVMFRDATIAGLFTTNPYLVPRGTLKRSGVKRFPYTVDEARALMRLQPDSLMREMMWNILAFYTGARCGEICGLLWKDWDELPKPLGALIIERQYAGEVLKTERPRIVPVHPKLAIILAWWRERWPVYFLRTPGPDDLIVPRYGHELAPIPLTKSSAYKAWLRSCKAAKVTNRSVHSTRHTFITVARRNGADKEAVELVTHNPKGTIVDRYTTREWAELCAAVACVSYDPPPSIGDGSVDGRSPFPAITGSRAWTRTTVTERNPRELGGIGESSPQPGTPERAASGVTGARVDARQPASIADELRAADDRAFRSKARFWFRQNARVA